MILIDKMKNLKIYRTQTFLPQLKEDKKKHSAVILMTPNYESSKKLMNHNLFVNKKRYESYYLDRDVSFYIGSKKLEEIDESFLYLAETKRSNLKDSEFGIPEDRKFPLDTEQHVRSAIKLFGHAHCSEEQKKTLARKISRRAKEYNIEIPETTLVYKYLHESVLECSDTNKNQKIFNIEKTDINSVKFFPNEEKRYDSIVVFNSIKDKCFRGRSVCIVIKDDSEVYLDFTFKYGDYDIPGGGWDPNEPHDVTATRECGEEAKLKVVDATYAGNYIEIFSEDDNRKHIDAIYWDGDYTELFVGKYAGKYEQKIADVDRSDTLIGGRFYPIAEVYNKLEDIHKAAILQYLGEEKLNKLLENSDSIVTEETINAGNIPAGSIIYRASINKGDVRSSEPTYFTIYDTDRDYYKSQIRNIAYADTGKFYNTLYESSYKVINELLFPSIRIRVSVINGLLTVKKVRYMLAEAYIENEKMVQFNSRQKFEAYKKSTEYRNYLKEIEQAFYDEKDMETLIAAFNTSIHISHDIKISYCMLLNKKGFNAVSDDHARNLYTGQKNINKFPFIVFFPMKDLEFIDSKDISSSEQRISSSNWEKWYNSNNRDTYINEVSMGNISTKDLYIGMGLVNKDISDSDFEEFLENRRNSGYGKIISEVYEEMSSIDPDFLTIKETAESDILNEDLSEYDHDKLINDIVKEASYNMEKFSSIFDENSSLLAVEEGTEFLIET